MKNCQSWILIGTRVTGQVASLLWRLNVAAGSCVGILWRPLVTRTIFDHHSATGERSDRSILLITVAIDERQVKESGDGSELFGWLLRVAAFAVVVTISQCSHKVEAFCSRLRVSWIILRHDDGETRVMLSVANQFAIVSAAARSVSKTEKLIETIEKKLEFSNYNFHEM